MPQFDKVTFFNQIFWFLLLFLTFYFVILKSLLPVLAASLKTRKKVANLFLLGSANPQEGSFKKFLYKNFQKLLKTSKTIYSTVGQNKATIFDASKSKYIGQTISSFK